MGKFALLIGVSQYELGLDQLPSTENDIREVKRILQDPAIGGFLENDIVALKDPERQEAEEAIYQLFLHRRNNDVLLFYFSGHGVVDKSNFNLYLASKTTRIENGDIVFPTAISAKSLHDVMNASSSKHQIVILDCCFSGAFAEGLKLKDDGSLNIQAQLGGTGRAILTSSDSISPSFHQEGYDLSTYTHFLVQGLETGEADYDKDGWISARELHEYIHSNIKNVAPHMEPRFFTQQEGYKICIAKSNEKVNNSFQQILFAATDFKNPNVKHLSREFQDLQRELKVQSHLTWNINRPNANFLEDFKKRFYELRPYIIHFSGYDQQEENLVIIDSSEKDILCDLEKENDFFEELSKFSRCVVINVCPSKEQAVRLAKHIEFVIGVYPGLEELEAIEFSRFFYEALIQKHPVEKAFVISKDRISQNRDSEDEIGFLVKRVDVLADLIDINKSKLSPEKLDFDLANETCNYLIQLCRYDEAILLYNQLLDNIGKTDGGALKRVAFVLRRKASTLEKIGKYKEALNCCEKALIIEPDKTYHLRQKASLLRHLEQLDESLLVFNKVLEIEPENYLAWSERGILLEELEKFDEAYQSYRKALSLSSDYELARNRCHLLKSKIKDLKENEIPDKSSAEIQNNNYEDWLTLGQISEFLEDFSTAAEAYEKALESDPNNVSTLTKLVEIFQKAKRHEDAVSICDRIIKLEPQNYVIRTQKGLLLLVLNQQSEALSSFKDSLKKSKASYRAAKYQQRWAYRGVKDKK